jgi:hypothetical protein
METSRIYLETTMFSFYYETRQEPHYQKLKAQVRQIFDQIKAGKYEPFTSEYATDEIANEKDPEKREKMAALITEYEAKLLEKTDLGQLVVKFL